jgi:ABC-type phosphate transport system auxiliary subunit
MLSDRVYYSRRMIFWGFALRWNQRFEVRMAEDEDREKPTKLPVLPKKEWGNLYGTYLYVQ